MADDGVLPVIQLDTARTSPAKPMEFRIGLAMAGAISAGAYTAGVLDFLVEALEAWEADRGKPGVPQHRTGLKVVAGASAGAITGALGLIALARGAQNQALTDAEIAEQDRTPGRHYNPFRCVLPSLYTTWVEQPRLVAHTPGELDFLHLSDLETPAGGKPPIVVSVLNSKLLDHIKDSALAGPAPAATPRPYVAKDMHLYMTVSNLRGIPFNVTFGAGQYGMQTHGDRFHYQLQGVGDWPCGGNAWLDPDPSIQLDAKDLPVAKDDPVTKEWSLYGTVALASAAFPIGLASRAVEAGYDQYWGRAYPVDADVKFITAPNFPGIAPGAPGLFKFLNVDGGLINNNPFDYAEYALLGRPRCRRDPDDDPTHEGQLTDAALIMIAPFPEPPAFLQEGRPTADLSAVLRALLPTLMTQARFRSSDLAKALDPENYSRYLIAPKRQDAAGKDATFAIACGALGGFGGFLDQAFRAHDYQLGRRNAQEFLSDVFGLPVGATHVDSSTKQHQFVSKQTDVTLASVIPRQGSAALEVAIPHWPRMSEADLDGLGNRIEQRLEKLVPMLIRAQTKIWWVRLMGAVWLFFGKKRLLTGVRFAILADLVRRDQVEGWDLPQDFACDPDKARAILAELVATRSDYRTIVELAKSTHLDEPSVSAIVGALKGAAGNLAIVCAPWDSSLLTLRFRAPTGLQALPRIRDARRRIEAALSRFGLPTRGGQA